MIRAAAPTGVLLTGPASAEDRAYHTRSPERRLSHQDLHESMVRIGVAAVEIVDITRVADWHAELAGADVVVINLHGEPGEDGTVQGLLQLWGVPFLGSRLEASAVGLNKRLTKLVALAEGVPTPPYFTVHDGRRNGRPTLPGEVICKPLRGGSSLGVHLLAAADHPLPATGEWIVEPFLRGDEVTVTVVEVDGLPIALPAIALRYDDAFYGHEEKLGPWSVPPAPAHRPDALHAAFRCCEEFAVRMHTAVGARHVSRSDFVVPADGGPQFLEINTMPGLSATSLCAHSAYAAGLRYDDLVTLVLAPSVRRP